MNKISVYATTVFMLCLGSQAHALNAESIYNKVNGSVYTIYTVDFYDKKPESLGSAIAVTEHILATNCHVALTGNYLGIVVNNQFKLGTLFFRDVNRDICFVEVPGVKFAPVKIRDSKDVKVGEQVYAVGNPEGLEKSISQGIISNKRLDRGGYVLQTDATVSFGSSGGGLFDQNGHLIGITNSVDKFSKNIAFAIPSEWISQILFPKAKGEQKIDKKATTAIEKSDSQPATDPKTVTKVGTFGKANVTLYRYNSKCFIFFTAKNEYGEVHGSAIWYPEKPGIILLFPDSIDIPKNFQIMNMAFYGDQQQSPTYSGNFLFFGDKKYELVGIKDKDGKYPLLVTKLPVDTANKLLTLSSFDIKYEDGVTVEGFNKASFSLDGLKEAMNAYQQQCKTTPPPAENKEQKS